jgi:hypothetical protein
MQNTKIKNQRQVTMMKGYGSAGGQRTQGDDLPINDVAGGNWKRRARVVAEPDSDHEDPEINRQCRKG